MNYTKQELLDLPVYTAGQTKKGLYQIATMSVATQLKASPNVPFVFVLNKTADRDGKLEVVRAAFI